MTRPVSHSSRTEAEPGPSPDSSRLKRAMLGGIGILFVGVAGLGVFLPGIPTVGPLILASLFLTKSSPRLERRLVRNPFFAKYLPYLDGTSEMSTRARFISLLLMWFSIGVSCLLLRYLGHSPAWITWVIVAAGLVGTLFILRFGKRRQDQSEPGPELEPPLVGPADRHP